MWGKDHIRRVNIERNSTRCSPPFVLPPEPGAACWCSSCETRALASTPILSVYLSDQSIRFVRYLKCVGPVSSQNVSIAFGARKLEDLDPRVEFFPFTQKV